MRAVGRDRWGAVLLRSLDWSRILAREHISYKYESEIEIRDAWN